MFLARGRTCEDGKRSLRNDKQNIEQHYQAQLQELKKTMVADVQRMQEEVRF